MKSLLKIASILFTLSISSANAADYFYCDCQAGASNECIIGNDSNNGTSPNNPKQTFSSANNQFNNMSAGDSIQFCRGGSFTSNSKHTWVNSNCSKDNTCNVTAYHMPGRESLNLALPIITQNSDSNLFSLDDSKNADHEEGYMFSNLDLRCNECANSWGFFLYNDIDHVTIENIILNGFAIGVHMSGSNPINSGSDGTQDFISLKNLTIINSHSQGILGGANNLEIRDSKFENNGTRVILDHNIYISRGNNITISGNDLYRATPDSNGKCAAVSLVAHGTINNLLIEDNVIREDINKVNTNCWGIAVDPGWGGKAEGFRNVTIRGNKVINVGNLAIGIASCDTCTIENNVILQHQPIGFTAIKAPDRSREDIDLPSTKVTIRNNSIYTSASGTGILLGTEGTQHTLVSNAIHYTGSGYYACINAGLAPSAYSEINNNICYFPNASSSSEWEAGSGTTPNALAAWQGQSSFGFNSKNSNPGFKNPDLPLVDFSPSTNTASPVSSGHNDLSSQKDIRGKSRDAQPDAGAYEYGTYNPPTKNTVFIIQ